MQRVSCLPLHLIQHQAARGQRVCISVHGGEVVHVFLFLHRTAMRDERRFGTSTDEHAGLAYNSLVARRRDRGCGCGCCSIGVGDHVGVFLQRQLHTRSKRLDDTVHEWRDLVPADARLYNDLQTLVALHKSPNRGLYVCYVTLHGLSLPRAEFISRFVLYSVGRLNELWRGLEQDTGTGRGEYAPRAPCSWSSGCPAAACASPV